MSPVNGIRPSPLRINKDSHVIQKSSSLHKVKQEQNQQRQPVIIYTHSPQVIHTNPKDFMALVQKLTGSGSESDRDRGRDRDDGKFEGKMINYKEGEVRMNPYLEEIPLFTPNSNNLFFSPKGFLKRNSGHDQSMVSLSPAGINADSISLSPTFMEFLNMKELPDY